MKRKERAYVVAQALIFAGVLLLVSLPIENGTLKDAPLIVPPTPPSSCGDQTELWGPNYGFGSPGASSSSVPVLLMHPDMTGFICVVYKSVSNGGVVPNATGFGEYLDGFQIFKSRCTTAGGGIGCSYRPSDSFETSGERLDSTAPFTSNSTTVYYAAVYSVTALSNATGFYTDSAPRPGCGGLPMAVGYSASQLDASDFTGFFPVGSLCIYSPFEPVEVGVIGIQLADVVFPN